MSKNISRTRIGIIGGGQLGKMMILEAKKMGFYITILDPTPNCPAKSISDSHIIANFDDPKALLLLSENSDVITYEFEHIDANTLIMLENKGKKIFPTPKSLALIQNKLVQKNILKEHNIPLSSFKEIKTTTDIEEYAKDFGFPLLLKTCCGGYDGKGNFFIRNEDDILKSFKFLDGDNNQLMIEEFVDFKMEVSVLACRGINGDIKIYPVAQNIHKDNILIETHVPADISDETSKVATDIAYSVMEVFCGVGMFCVEMFVTSKNNILVNEIAPRPHNSGHYTIEGCVTSQFEQHIRAIVGLPLGDPSLLRPTVMQNLLGETTKKSEVSGMENALSYKGVSLHIYGKEYSSPKRKMGHLTVTADSIFEAINISRLAKEKIKI